MSRNDNRVSGPLESPPPPLPVRCSSVSRSKPPSHPPPPPAPKPSFDVNKSLVESVKRTTRNRLATQESKPKPPPVPTHRRSKSEGKSPFGEESLRPSLDKNLSVPNEDMRLNRPAPPPRPKSLKKPTSDDGKPVNPAGGGPKITKPATLPRYVYVFLTTGIIFLV